MLVKGRCFAISTAFSILLMISACSIDDVIDGGSDGDGDGSGDGSDGGPDDPGDVEPTAEISVCASGEADHATIAHAIDAAPAGALITVCAGTYPERLVIEHKGLILRGEEAGATILDAGGDGVALTVRDTSDPGLRVEGLTIRGGASNGAGGGVRCQDSWLALAGDVLRDNRADTGGGGLYADACELEVTDTAFLANQGAERGGGALLVDTSGEVSGGRFEDNQAVYGGGVHIAEGSVLLRDNSIENNVAELRGGGLYHDSDAPVEDNVIADNAAGWTGGGVHIVEHAPVLRGNQVRGNRSENDGGGIYVHQGTAAILDGEISDNWSGDDGGGLRLFESRARIEGNRIIGNVTGDSGGGVRVSHEPALFVDNEIRDNEAILGGGIDMDNDSSVVRGGVIEDNVAWRGGGISAMIWPWRDGTIEGVRIAGNRAGYGGGLYLENNFYPVALRDLHVVDNVAWEQGGGLFVRATDVTIRNSAFARNLAEVEGGGLYVGEPEPWESPDPCPCPPLSPSIDVDFVVLHENQAGSASAIFVDTGGLSIGNSILSGHSGMAVVALGPEPVWRYNDTVPDTFAGMANPTGSSGNISADPLFVDLSSFQLRSGSPCRNAGDPALQDPDGTRADMGRHGGPEAP